MNWELVFSVISGLCVCIPLVIKLGTTIHSYAQEKNWSAIIKIVIEYMKEAEKLYSTGAERKEYVMAAVEQAAILVDYTFDDTTKQKVSRLIDDICSASKIINSGVVVNGT